MDGADQGLNAWPIAVWVVAVAAAAFAARFTLLSWWCWQARAEGLAAERRLTEAATRLREYASANLQRLPERLEEALSGSCTHLAYRPVPRLTLDERLILVHDARPTHKLMEFPNLRDGRAVVLCSGRLLVVTEEAFEKLVQADDALRQQHGLEAVTSGDA
ncbi:MAG: hypothetical protein HY718_09835 [Planctomycetes bacterium]|nr:hypothetical protein [Planctomycetota bacterium]